MRPVTMYEAVDGSIHDLEADALKRDALVAECASEVSRIGLRPTPSGTDFGNGGGFVQQPRGARACLFDFLREKGVGRDTQGPLGNLLYRAWRIDDLDREWGQQFYANNPTKGEQREVSA